MRAAPAVADDFPSRPITILIPLAAITAAIKSPDIWQQMITMGLLPVDTPPVEELQHFAKSEIGHWGDLVRKIGIAGTE
jgi:tripartite-type tricarboxylate transporter receptor subunit TctC